MHQRGAEQQCAQAPRRRNDGRERNGSIQRGIVHGIFNQDPACDLDFCANTAREMKIDYAVKNSFGFGGTNGTLVFKKV